ncbi:MlaD family protein [Nocardia niwae]|uniref:MlaD family protein n=1 Tax=Nocardia niwae TaxID=626084 RepID=A0ABV2XGN5_9NOCA
MSLTAIAAVLVLGVTYVWVGVLHLDPRATHITVDLHLDNAGGLIADAPVLLTGVPVGKAEAVRKQGTGALVRLRIDSRYRIPEASTVRVEQLSALGESYIEFAPGDGGSGPYLRDGQVIETNRIRMPMTITALSAKLVELLDQVHPEAIANLVDTFDRALTGTDAAMRTLQRSTTLLAAVLLSRTDAIRQLFSDVQAMGGDMDWLGPALAGAGPQFGNFGITLSAIVESGSELVERRPVADYFTGDGITPFLAGLTDLLNKIGPSIAPLGPALEPVVRSAVDRAPTLDISALIDQALQGVGTDGTVHFKIGLK